MALPTDLATGDIINETWVDAVVAELAALAPGSTRYPPKPSGDVVYGVKHYEASLAANYIATTAAAPIVTIAMPAVPAGTLLDLSMHVYCSVAVGIGNGYFNFRVNGVMIGPPTTVAPDLACTMSYSGRLVNVAAPVGIAYNVEVMAAKAVAGGTCTVLAGHTHLSVVSYRP